MIAYSTELTGVTHCVLYAKGIPKLLCSGIPMLLFISLFGKYYLGHFKATVSDPDKSGSEIYLSLSSLTKYGTD